MCWNVRGSMRMLHSCGRTMGLLSRYSIVGLVHTGHDGSDTQLDGFTCLRALPRPVDTTSGGVALFVRTSLAHKAMVVRERADMGILWIRFEGVFMALAYLPHQNSSMYTHEGLDREAHWHALTSDVAEFQASGPVMVLGDLNARTGACLETDADAQGEWAALSLHAGITIDASILHPALAHIGPRQSCDTQVNAMGKDLLQMCKSRGLVILNGRLPGDETGTWTFYGSRRRRSVIDYVLASPGLAFTAAGGVLRGARMHMIHHPERIPLRPGAADDGLFDHMPVGVRFRLPRKQPAARTATSTDTPLAERWLWRDELRSDFVAALADPSVQTCWQQLNDDSVTGTEALEAFLRGLTSAVHATHAKHGRVVHKPSSKERHGRPTNTWYDRDCVHARDTLSAQARQFGQASAQARAARQAYRKVVRAAKARHTSAHGKQMAQHLYDDPRLFWKSFKGSSATTLGDAAQWTGFFTRLFQANVAGEYAGGDLEAHCAAYPDLFPSPNLDALAAASVLNDPFTQAEVHAALGQLACHKAAGVDGMPAEFLQQAYVQHGNMREYALCPVLTKLFNAVWRGAYPCVWQVSALVPVPKPKGRPDVYDDHRGIAVSPVAAKLFAMVMLARLDRWAEGRGLRAKGQAGFRAGRGTPDNLFVLRHMLDAAAARERPLFCAYIDFSKAYDRVDRAILWRVLRGCGLHGAALGTVQAMYESVRMQVRMRGKLGSAFESGVGVKQGCPLSPLLFGILVDRLEPFLERRCPGVGTHLATSLVRALLYADDVVLASETADGLRSMLQALEVFCRANSLFVNTKKSEVVVYGRRWISGAMLGGLEFPFNGAPLPVKPSYIYLGLRFEEGQPCRAHLTTAVDKARKAMYGLLGKCRSQGLRNVDLQCHLFDALVKPILCYGCEVWGVDWVAGMCQTGNFSSGTGEESVHKPFLRHILGVCKSTSGAAMYRDLDRTPIPMFWLRMAAKLWNRALSRPHGDLLQAAVRENAHMAHDPSLTMAARRRMWSFHFTRCMDEFGIAWKDEQAALQKVDLAGLEHRMAERWKQKEWGQTDDLGAAWSLQPCAVRAAPEGFSRGFKLYTYANWFAPETWVRRESWTRHLARADHVRAMAQFRLGSHWLQIQQGRFARTPRSQRCCTHCAGCVEDEAHILQCPKYLDLRQRFRVPTMDVPTDASIRAAFSHNTEHSWNAFAEFLVHCRLRRTDVTWTHQ